ncbi:hypothetical protein CR513_19828, partial [Mucuna pruriens]
MKNRQDEMVPAQIQNSWRVCINYKKLNQATCKDHFPLPFIAQVLEKLAKKSHYCSLDGFSKYMQIHIASVDQHKMTFTCPFEGIVLGYLVSSRGIEIDKAKVDIIASLPNPASMRCIKNISKIALPLSKLLQKDVDFIFYHPYVEAFQELKKQLTSTSIL